MIRPVDWGPVVLGILGGLGISLVVALVAAVLTSDPLGRDLVRAAAQFTGQTAAGYLAARFAGHDHLLQGSYGALGLYALTTSLALAVGSDPGLTSLALFAAVAALLGAAGGLLAARGE